jgi:hypothetical protein
MDDARVTVFLQFSRWITVGLSFFTIYCWIEFFTILHTVGLSFFTIYCWIEFFTILHTVGLSFFTSLCTVGLSGEVFLVVFLRSQSNVFYRCPPMLTFPTDESNLLLRLKVKCSKTLLRQFQLVLTTEWKMDWPNIMAKILKSKIHTYVIILKYKIRPYVK